VGNGLQSPGEHAHACPHLKSSSTQVLAKGMHLFTTLRTQRPFVLQQHTWMHDWLSCLLGKLCIITGMSQQMAMDIEVMQQKRFLSHSAAGRDYHHLKNKALHAIMQYKSVVFLHKVPWPMRRPRCYRAHRSHAIASSRPTQQYCH
jgi:hypothetical protein